MVGYKLLTTLDLLTLSVSVSVFQGCVAMQIEQQCAPKTTSRTESVESKASNRGGKRPGAGRKPNLAKRLLRGFSREAIHEAVAGMDVGMVIQGLMRSKSDRTKLETLIFVRGTLIAVQRRT